MKEAVSLTVSGPAGYCFFLKILKIAMVGYAAYSRVKVPEFGTSKIAQV